MPFNNLFSSFQHTPQQTPKFLAIEIGLDSLKTALWEITDRSPHLLQLGTIEEVDSNNQDELLTALDRSISKASLSLSSDPSEVIFSFPESWISQGEIVKEKKILLKHLCSKLDLKPMGFVLTTEAIIQHLQTTKGHPPTCILLGVTNEDILVTLVQNGTIVSTQQVGRSDDIGADTEEGLARFGKVNQLPSYFVLYDGHINLDSLEQDLLSYNWQSRLPFLHIPKITHLSSTELLTAIIATAGAEIIKTQSPNETTTEVSQDSTTPQFPDLQQEFGFHSTSTKLTPQTDIEPTETDEDNSFQTSDSNLETIDDDSPSIESSPFSMNQPEKKPRMSMPKLPRFNIHFPFIIFSGLILIFSLLTLTFLAYWFLPQAEVTIYINPLHQTQNVSFIADPNTTSVDVTNQKIPGQLNTNKFTSSKSTTTTGTKTVGDKATGTVTIYNRTDSTKTLPSGTKLTSSSLIFYTDKEIKIASASTKENSDLSVTIQPSSLDISVTAGNIGSQYNLQTNSEFSVGNFDKSSFIAKSKSDFSGGSSRQVSVVSENDIKNLRSQVKEDLETQAASVPKDSSSDVSTIIIPSQKDSYSEQLSATLGSEASSVDIESTDVINTLTFYHSDASSLIKQLPLNIPAGYHLDAQATSFQVTSFTLQPNETINITAQALINLVPEFDQNALINKLKGRYPEYTQQAFKEIPGYNRVEILITPSFLPARLKTFPRQSNKILLKVINRQS